eukprot:TRINITY_DN36651_c0_g2_i1.p1 TRINITY_DN36651_c0_g2~~TRINITY_DN36651_c0_g2_i1.p1  ORF type:complete len:489 (-),score=83.01 TRINITY_DN36651_c0_g2_i1:72-1538(-)
MRRSSTSPSPPRSALEHPQQRRGSKKAKRRQSRPDTADKLLASLNGCKSGSNWIRALDFISGAIATRVPTATRAFNVALSVAASARWAWLLQLLEEMSDRHVERDVVSCNVRLSAESKMHFWTACLETLGAAAREGGALFGIRGLGAVASAASRVRTWTSGLRVLDIATVASIKSNVIVYSSIMAEAKQGRQAWALAPSLLARASDSTMAIDTITGNVAMAACWAAARWPLALQARRQLAVSGVPATAATHNAMINAAAELDLWQLSTTLLGDALDGLHDSTTYIVALKAWARGSSWSLAVSTLSEIRADRTQLDIVALNAATKAATQEHAWRRGLRIAATLRRQDVKLDIVTWNTVAAAQQGEEAAWRQVVAALLEGTEREALESTNVTMSTALNAYAVDAEWELALESFARAAGHEGGAQCEPATLHALMDSQAAASRWARALECLCMAAVRGLELAEAIAFNVAAVAAASFFMWGQAGHRFCVHC